MAVMGEQEAACWLGTQMLPTFPFTSSPRVMPQFKYLLDKFSKLYWRNPG